MCIKYSIIKYIDTATHSSGCFSMCRIKKGIVSGQRKASKSLMRNWKFANRSRHWCCPPVPLPAFPYTSIAQFLALGQLGASSLSRAIKSPTMVSGQWEVNSRHWGEVEEFLPEEELASMPLTPPPSPLPAGTQALSCRRQEQPSCTLHMPSRAYRQMPLTKDGWGKDRRSLGPNGHPKGTPPALDTQLATGQ